MHLLVSGEGATDFGLCDMGLFRCSADLYLAGPMAMVVDQLLQRQLGYSLLDTEQVELISKQVLVEHAEIFRRDRRRMRLTGRDRPQETAYFFRNAQALGAIAAEKEAELGCPVVAALFRDSDGTASAGRGQWQDKWHSMIDGFEAGGCARGVPMLPRPKSEAWVICALRDPPYSNCDELESRSGNDASPNSLKRELEALHGTLPTREELCEMVASAKIDVEKIGMPSFVAFRDRLEIVAGAL